MFTRVLTDTWTWRPSFLPSLTSGTNLMLEEKTFFFLGGGRGGGGRGPQGFDASDEE